MTHSTVIVQLGDRYTAVVTRDLFAVVCRSKLRLRERLWAVFCRAVLDPPFRASVRQHLSGPIIAGGVFEQDGDVLTISVELGSSLIDHAAQIGICQCWEDAFICSPKSSQSPQGFAQ